MHLQPHLVRVFADIIHLRRRIHRSTSHVVRIFQAHQRRLGIVINLRPDHRLDLLPRQNPVFAACHSRHASGDRRHRRQLVQIHVTAFFTNYFIAVVRPHFDANEIPHASRGYKQRRLFPENLRSPFLQPVDGGIFSVHVIPDFRFRHRTPHLCRRPRHSVAPQIHHSLRNLTRLHDLVRIDPLISLRHRVTHVLPLLGLRVTFSPLLFSASSASLRYRSPLLSYLINSTNTSFETLNFPGASRTTPPSRSTKPAEASGSNRPANATPYIRSIRVTSIPSSCRNPRNNSSSSALSAVSASCCSTGNRPLCTAVTYSAASCAFAHRSAPENECAPAPNPRYGSRRQYFKLCFDSYPGLAQFEIS